MFRSPDLTSDSFKDRKNHLIMVDLRTLRAACKGGFSFNRKRETEMKVNKIHRISLTGGLIGELFTNPRRALESAIKTYNANGWYCIQILPHTTTNIFIKFLQLVCLICTLGIWTFGNGYLLLLEKEENDAPSLQTNN